MVQNALVEAKEEILNKESKLLVQNVLVEAKEGILNEESKLLVQNVLVDSFEEIADTYTRYKDIEPNKANGILKEHLPDGNYMSHSSSTTSYSNDSCDSKVYRLLEI